MAPPMASANYSSTVQVHVPITSASTTLHGAIPPFPTPGRNGTGQPSHVHRKKAFIVLLPVAMLTLLGIAGVETIEHFGGRAKSSNTTDEATREDSVLGTTDVTDMFVTQQPERQSGGPANMDLEKRRPPNNVIIKEALLKFALPGMGWFTGLIGLTGIIKVVHKDKAEKKVEKAMKHTGAPSAQVADVQAKSTEKGLHCRSDHPIQHANARIQPRAFKKWPLVKFIAQWGWIITGYLLIPVGGAWQIVKHKKKLKCGPKYRCPVANGTTTANATLATNKAKVQAVQLSDAATAPRNKGLQARGHAPITPKGLLALFGVVIPIGSAPTLGLALGIRKSKLAKDSIKAGKEKAEKSHIKKTEKKEREQWKKDHPRNSIKRREIEGDEAEEGHFLPLFFDLGYLASTAEHNVPHGLLNIGIGEHGNLDILAEGTGIHLNGTISKIHHTTEGGIAVGNFTINLPGGNNTFNAGHWYSVSPEEKSQKGINAFAEMFANRTIDDTNNFNLTVDIDAMTRHWSFLLGKESSSTHEEAAL